eukprot:scaffold20574_cov99-Amphora_coffeaeformis.AAC.1
MMTSFPATCKWYYTRHGMNRMVCYAMLWLGNYWWGTIPYRPVPSCSLQKMVKYAKEIYL